MVYHQLNIYLIFISYRKIFCSHKFFIRNVNTGDKCISNSFACVNTVDFGGLDQEGIMGMFVEEMV